MSLELQAAGALLKKQRAYDHTIITDVALKLVKVLPIVMIHDRGYGREYLQAAQRLESFRTKLRANPRILAGRPFTYSLPSLKERGYSHACNDKYTDCIL